MIRIGFSGAMHPSLEAVLPATRGADFDRVAFLGGLFGCVEIDTTAHVIPRREHVARWSSALAECPRTRLVLRLPAVLLDRSQPDADRRRWTESFVASLQPVLRRDRLGAVVATLPSSDYLYGPREVRELEQLGRLLAPSPLVLEAEHASWYAETSLNAVRGAGWSLAYLDGLDRWDAPPTDHAPTGRIGMLRLMRQGPIAPETIGAFARRAQAMENRFDTLYVVTDDPESARSPRNFTRIAAALETKYVLAGQKPVRAWPEIVAALPHLAPLTEA